jgi:hypothetical protein
MLQFREDGESGTVPDLSYSEECSWNRIAESGEPLALTNYLVQASPTII